MRNTNEALQSVLKNAYRIYNFTALSHVEKLYYRNYFIIYLFLLQRGGSKKQRFRKYSVMSQSLRASIIKDIHVF